MTTFKFSDIYEKSTRYIAKTQNESSPFFVPVGEVRDWLTTGFNWLDEVVFYKIDCRDTDPHGHLKEQKDSRKATVFTDRKLNLCEQRFVQVKELMHLFDSEVARTNSVDKFKMLLEEIEHDPVNPSAMYTSEHYTKWMALLILCPRKFRDPAKKRYDDDNASYYDIALEFRITEGLIPDLFSEFYEDAEKSLVYCDI